METADDVVLPALLRAARGAYGEEIARRLDAAGLEDLPRHGGFVLGAMVNHGATAPHVVVALGLTKQRASQLVDVLVLRGYLTREPDPEDGRRIVLRATSRGEEAARAVRAGVLAVDGRLEGLLAPEGVAALRRGLVALASLREHPGGNESAANPPPGGSRSR